MRGAGAILNVSILFQRYDAGALHGLDYLPFAAVRRSYMRFVRLQQ